MARPKAYKGHNPLYGHACAAFSVHSATHQVISNTTIILVFSWEVQVKLGRCKACAQSLGEVLLVLETHCVKACQPEQSRIQALQCINGCARCSCS